MRPENASPYLMEEPPTSTGRVLLSRAFSHWCVLHYGHSDDDIVAAFDPGSKYDDAARRQIGMTARLLGELLCAGVMRAFTRPIGDGSPAPLAASVWERDDYRPVFDRSALDPARPFDGDAPPTHWIFLDAEDFDEMVQRSVGLAEDVNPGPPDVSDLEPLPTPGRAVGQHVRMPELERRTGMSRATIYRRIAEKRFPERIPMDGNISAWRESDVAEWLANPR